MNTTTITDRFVRSDDFAAKLDGLYLPNEAWSIFAQLEQPTSAEELARQLEMPSDAVLDAINALLTHGLIRKQLLNWREFLAQKGIKIPSAISPPETAPVAEARAAGRPGAALAGWPKPSAPRIDSEITPATTTSEMVSPPAAAQPAEEQIPSATEQAAAPSVDELAAISPPPAPLPAAESPATPAHPAPTSEDAPPLFSDFKLPEPRAVVEPAEPPAPSSAPIFVQPKIPAHPAREDARVSPPVAQTPTSRLSTSTPPATETVLPVSFSIVNEKARLERKATAAMTISFRLAAPSKESATSWRLKPLLNAIMQKAGGGLAGQLLVYRVFIHVPAEMMHAAGIQSLSLVDDSVIVRDRAFYDALCQAARAVASVDLRGVKA